jgi:hypothetical protein
MPIALQLVMEPGIICPGFGGLESSESDPYNIHHTVPYRRYKDVRVAC